MRVMYRTPDFSLTESLRDHCERHVVDHLARFFDDAAAYLVIELRNGALPHERECHLAFSMPGHRKLFVSQVSHDAHKAIDLARDRLVRHVKDEQAKARQPVAHPLHNPNGRVAAAAERQRESIEDYPDASEPRVDEPDPYESVGAPAH